MTEATWGDATKTPDIEWTMSASLANVVRGGEDVPEVTNLQAAVRAWTTLDPAHRDQAVLTPERPILLDGASVPVFHGEAIAVLVERLPG
ncbi:hypothetical protein U1701_12630 [Sphingomonas sp. PB2P19]|uniref:hypothetical protein n=1 Tax=Sphingomonas rhamnosi TaxID=3096156 RepID=UPI002FC6115F